MARKTKKKTAKKKPAKKAASKPKVVRDASGKKPVYFDPVSDKLIQMILALLGELSVMRDRLDTVERLVEKNKLFSQADIEAFELTPEANKARAARRAATIARVLKTVQNDLDALIHK